MTLMVLATACAGFLCSVILLRFGVTVMWLRYSLAVMGAYGVFLGLIYVWLLVAQDAFRVEVHVDAVDALDGVDFAGGLSLPAPEPSVLEAPSSGGGSGGPDPSLDLDGEGLIVVAVVAVTVGVAVVASVYVILQAPTLLAEVLLDGALSFGLYRRLRSLERRHWLESAVIRTRFPVFWVLLFFFIAGLVMQAYAPEAVSIGGVWARLQANGFS